jgi:hypothetical protein
MPRFRLLAVVKVCPVLLLFVAVATISLCAQGKTGVTVQCRHSASTRASGDCASGRSVSVGEIITHPDIFQDKTVRLRGRLVNKGKNYFTNLRLMFRDQAGKELPVVSKIPLEVHESSSTDAPAPQRTLAEILDTDIEVIAIVKLRAENGYQQPSLTILCVKNPSSNH